MWHERRVHEKQKGIEDSDKKRQAVWVLRSIQIMCVVSIKSTPYIPGTLVPVYTVPRRSIFFMQIYSYVLKYRASLKSSFMWKYRCYVYIQYTYISQCFECPCDILLFSMRAKLPGFGNELHPTRGQQRRANQSSDRCGHKILVRHTTSSLLWHETLTNNPLPACKPHHCCWKLLSFLQTSRLFLWSLLFTNYNKRWQHLYSPFALAWSTSF